MIKTYRDGRVKLTGKDYTDAKKAKWEAQNRYCALCGLYLPLAMSELDHIRARGMSGSKRDDRPDNLQVVHRHCHFARHHRERDAWAKIQPESI